MNQHVRLLTLLFMLGVLAGLAGGCCVAERTFVATPTGDRSVETLTPGDEVISVSAEGKPEVGTVTRLRKSKVVSCLQITLADGSCLRATGWHPVATRTGWVSAGRLAVGQELKTCQGWQAVTVIEAKWGLVNVYDLTVMPHGNFIADGVVVHNKSVAAPTAPSELPGAWLDPSLDGSRMVLYADGTGVYAWYTHAYRITRWTTNASRWSPYYEFHATLKSVDKTRSDGGLSGTVGPGYIDLREHLGQEGGSRYHLRREEEVEKNISRVKEIMRPYEHLGAGIRQ